MEDNSQGYHHRHRILKDIPIIDHPQRAHNDLPMPSRGDAPMRVAPHDAGPRAVVKVPVDSRRPANDMGPGLLPQNGPIDENPHRYNVAGGVKQEANTYGLARVPRR